jgi:predicted aspartyl protease
MGQFTAIIGVSSLEGGDFTNIEALVDTGATYSRIP